MAIMSFHNPDQYMSDLRQILSQGRKRIGLLLGAGAPNSIWVDDDNNIVSENGHPLIPGIDRLTESVIEDLGTGDQGTIATLKKEYENLNNIEDILTQVRKLAQAIGRSTVHGLDAQGYEELGTRICDKIGNKVGAYLPDDDNPYSALVAWIAGTSREHSIEIFTPNYDLLIEESFERHKVAFFDGFVGSFRPFFDPVSVSSDSLPPRWALLWKLHGSLGWKVYGHSVVRTGLREATELIYPDHLKYDEISRQPYSALFERLREFLMMPDTLLICSGFSFRDFHIRAVIHEGLAANPHTAVFAFQYKTLDEETAATSLAKVRPNMSVYAKDGAIISGTQGKWMPGQPPNERWQEIRRTFWDGDSETDTGQFLLGDFARLADFLRLIQTQQVSFSTSNDVEVANDPVTLLSPVV